MKTFSPIKHHSKCASKILCEVSVETETNANIFNHQQIKSKNIINIFIFKHTVMSMAEI